MGSPPTSDTFRFLDSAGRVTAAPGEWTSARIALDVPEDRWNRVCLTLQGQRLDVVLRMAAAHGEERPLIVADWPRLGPGRYRLELSVGDGPVSTSDILIRPSKISQAAFEGLIEDLETRLPASIAIALQRLGALAGIHLLPPGETTRAQELTRLRRAVQGADRRLGLSTVLPAIGRDPYRMLRQEEPWLDRSQARRPVPARLADAVRRAHNLEESRKPRQVLDTRVEHTVDVYENRLLKLYTSQVIRRLLRLVRFHGLETSDAIAERAVELLKQLRRARMQAPFLDHVALPAALPERVSMVLLKRPPYRAMFEGYLEFHRSPIVRMEEPALETGLEGLPRLYQVWATLQLFDVLLSVVEDLGYRLVTYSLLKRDAEGFFVQLVPDGRPAIQLLHEATGTSVWVIPERTYGRYGDLHSVSFDQRPDIAVEVQRQDGSREIYLFDPKYKLDSEASDGQTSSRPVKVDIDKMHAYRDAIRDSSGTPVVCYAAIMYPGDSLSYQSASGVLPLVEALHAYPGDEATLTDRLREVLCLALSVKPVLGARQVSQRYRNIIASGGRANREAG